MRKRIGLLGSIVAATSLSGCAHQVVRKYTIPEGSQPTSYETLGPFLDTAYSRFDNSIKAELMAVPWYDHKCDDIEKGEIKPLARTHATGINRYVELCPGWSKQMPKYMQRTVYHELLHQAERRRNINIGKFGDAAAAFFLDVRYGDHYSDTPAKRRNFIKKDLWDVTYELDDDNELILQDKDDKWGREEFARIGANLMNTSSDEEAYKVLNKVPPQIIELYRGVIADDYLALRNKKPIPKEKQKEQKNASPTKKEHKKEKTDEGVPIQRPQDQKNNSHTTSHIPNGPPYNRRCFRTVAHDCEWHF